MDNEKVLKRHLPVNPGAGIAIKATYDKDTRSLEEIFAEMTAEREQDSRQKELVSQGQTQQEGEQ